MAELLGAKGVAVEFENLTVTLGGNTILERVSARVPRGSWTAIVGPNGAGKTTLVLALLGEVPYAGKIRIHPKEGRQKPRLGYVPQRIQFDRGMPLTVLEFLVMGWQRTPLWFGVRRACRGRARELLASVKMEGVEERKIGALSGGEMQRVLLALALAQEPDLLILDEPNSGVDLQGEHVFCELLENLRREFGFTQFMVTHDLTTVTHHADHVICLSGRVVAEGPPCEVLTAETLKAIFGLHMGLVNSRALVNEKCSCPSCSCAGNKDHA